MSYYAPETQPSEIYQPAFKPASRIDIGEQINRRYNT